MKLPRSNKAAREAADEAYLRSQQIDLLAGSIPSLSSVPEPTMISTVPDTCPSCARRMSLESGWTTLSVTTAGVGVLQCGSCGHSISVPTEVYAGYTAQLKALADQRAAAIQARHAKPDRGGRRTRGAG